MLNARLSERGQTMIIMVFAMIGLLAMTGLAIDGGTVYVERRRMQNAADSAALAGTRLLSSAICDSASADDATIAAEVDKYAQQNGVPAGNVVADYVNADENVLGRVGSGSIPNGATGISATVAISRSTYFVSLLGIDTSSASAPATAMTGPIRQLGGGVMPVGVPVQQVEAIIEHGTTNFTIFDRSGAICSQDGVVCPSDPPAQASRGWLNFNYIYNGEINAGGSTSDPRNRVIATNMSNSDLKEWAENGCPHPLYTGTRGGLPPYLLDGDFIVGQPGARESSRKAVCDNHLGEMVYMPVFDYVEQKSFMSSNFTEPANPLGFPGGQFLYYHLVGFVAAELNDCGGKTIGGEFQFAIIGNEQIDPSSGSGYQGGSSSAMCSDGSMIMGVVLWE
jgi:Flp pilus assembly protein TadG